MTPPARSGAGRARRVDADRNVEAIIQAGLAVLARDPGASVTVIANAAGLTRATVYRHFPTSEALASEIFRRAIAETEAALDAAGLDEGDGREALERFVRVAWAAADPYRLVRTMVSATEVEARAQKIKARLDDLLRRGQRAGVLRDDVSAGWLADVVEALIFRTSDGVARGEWDADDALAALWHTVDVTTRPFSSARQSSADG